MPEHEFEAEDLEGALRAASEALGTPTQALDYELIEHGRRGVFGIGSRNVRIRVRREANSPVLAESLRKILDLSGLDLEFEVSQQGDGLTIRLDGPDRKLLAQKDGELVAALQLLLNRMGRRTWPEAGRIRLEFDGYRRRDENEVVELAREVAEQVARTGRAKQLHEMNPYERRLVHLTVKEFPALVSRSVGDGFLKKVNVTREGASRRRRSRRPTAPRAEG